MGFIGSILYGTVSLVSSIYMTFFPLFASRPMQKIEAQKANYSFFTSETRGMHQSLDAIVDNEHCESLEFISDVTYPDGTIVEANSRFLKTWKIRNNGCDLDKDNPGYLTYVIGTSMGSQTYVLPYIKSGETKDISLWLQAPAIPGKHRVSYMAFVIENENFRVFGEELWAEVTIDGLAENSRFIVVDIQDQRVYAFLNGEVKTFSVSTGIYGRDTEITGSENPTYIWLKYASQDMDGSMYGYEYKLYGVKWVTYFNRTGEAFHGTYWHNNFGSRMSSGCVNMTNADAKWIFENFMIGDEVYVVNSIADFSVDFFNNMTQVPEYSTPAVEEYQIPQWKLDKLEMR